MFRRETESALTDANISIRHPNWRLVDRKFMTSLPRHTKLLRPNKSLAGNKKKSKFSEGKENVAECRVRNAQTREKCRNDAVEKSGT